MKFSPKCNTMTVIGKFVIKFGNFCLYLGKNKFGLGKSCNIVQVFSLGCSEKFLSNLLVLRLFVYTA